MKLACNDCYKAGNKKLSRASTFGEAKWQLACVLLQPMNGCNWENRGKEQSSKQVRENVEVLKSAGKVQQQEILPRSNFSLYLASDVHVRTFYFGFIYIILLCINQSLKTETEGYLNTVR